MFLKLRERSDLLIGKLLTVGHHYELVVRVILSLYYRDTFSRVPLDRHFLTQYIGIKVFAVPTFHTLNKPVIHGIVETMIGMPGTQGSINLDIDHFTDEIPGIYGLCTVL